MGLINFIREKLPEPLEKAGKQLRMKDQLVHRIDSAVPHCYKNRYHYKEAIRKVRTMFFHWERGTSIYHLINMEDATDPKNMEKWKKLESLARNIQEQCM